jgi:hypothetical protein
VIETAHAQSIPSRERELAPNVWLKQTNQDGQFVEIVMPPFELNDLIQECESSFPTYAIQVLEVLARNDPTALVPGMKLTLELTKGLFNTQILGTVLTRHQVCEEKALPVMTELQQAFGLVMQGRLRLTADPILEAR